MGPLTIDASVLVGALSASEAGQEECAGLLEIVGHDHRPVIVPTLAIVELAAAFSRRSMPAELVRRLTDRVRSLPALTLVPLDQALMEECVEAALSTTMRGADAVYVAVAQRYGATLVTTDEQQLRRVPAGLEALSPAEVLARSKRL